MVLGAGKGFGGLGEDRGEEEFDELGEDVVVWKCLRVRDERTRDQFHEDITLPRNVFGGHIPFENPVLKF